MIIKVCGMRNAENIRAVELSGADWQGFIFYPPSPRFVGERPDYLPARTKRTGVFVNADTGEILSLAKAFGLDLVQLYGDVPTARCRELRAAGLSIIRAINIGSSEDAAKASAIQGYDYLLFDTKTPSFGGSGKMFNWEVLQSYSGNTPFIISGGIKESSLSDILRFKHPRFAGIDLNSGFETSPAMKDAKALARFISAIREEENRLPRT